MDIFKADLNGLKKNGLVVVSTTGSQAKLKPDNRTYKRVLMDISRVSHQNLMIDNATKNPGGDLNIYHLPGLHKKCVVDNEMRCGKYSAGKLNYDAVALLKYIRGRYGKYLR